MYIVGLTGGIGSGKSAAAERFRQHNVNIVNTDDVSREVVMPGTEALGHIVQKFGAEVLNSDGSLNRKALRAYVFDDSDNRQWLENLLHPLIQQASNQQLHGPQKAGEPPYRILEVPLLFETNGQHRVNRVLLITADHEARIQRVIERDNTDRQQVLAILEAQLPDNYKRSLADDCIDNSGSLEALYREIDAMHHYYCNLAVKS